MEFSEKWGQDVDEAVKLALKDLKCTIEEADIVVLEEPSKGFLGLGAKLAKVRVTRKEPEAKKSVTAASEKPQIAAETTFQRKETQPEYREKREPRENHGFADDRGRKSRIQWRCDDRERSDGFRSNSNHLFGSQRRFGADQWHTNNDRHWSDGTVGCVQSGKIG